MALTKRLTLELSPDQTRAFTDAKMPEAEFKSLTAQIRVQALEMIMADASAACVECVYSYSRPDTGKDIAVGMRVHRPA